MSPCYGRDPKRPVSPATSMGTPNDLSPVPDLTRLDAMLTRLKLTPIRDRLDMLLAEEARRELTLA